MILRFLEFWFCETYSLIDWSSDYDFLRLIDWLKTGIVKDSSGAKLSPRSYSHRSPKHTIFWLLTWSYYVHSDSFFFWKLSCFWLNKMIFYSNTYIIYFVWYEILIIKLYHISSEFVWNHQIPTWKMALKRGEGLEPPYKNFPLRMHFFYVLANFHMIYLPWNGIWVQLQVKVSLNCVHLPPFWHGLVLQRSILNGNYYIPAASRALLVWLSFNLIKSTLTTDEKFTFFFLSQLIAALYDLTQIVQFKYYTMSFLFTLIYSLLCILFLVWWMTYWAHTILFA